MNSGFRHLARQIVIKGLFWYQERPEVGEETILEYLLNNDEGRKLPETEFTKKTFTEALAYKDKADELITKYAPDWPLEKIARSDLAVLRLGIYELLENKEIPPLVAINEAVELSKEFGDPNASQFINGVLSQIGKDILGPDKLKARKK